MLSAVDRAGGRSVSPEEVIADGGRLWELSCPTCRRDVHLVRAVTPHFAHAAGVPARSCALRNDNPSGDAELPGRRLPIFGGSPARPSPPSGDIVDFDPKPWLCPICDREAEDTDAGPKAIDSCALCWKTVCGDCLRPCNVCGKKICVTCPESHVPEHLTPRY